jgi:hypothetical protein
MLDRLNGRLKVEKAVVFFTNFVEMVEVPGKNEKGKDWGKILKYLAKAG